MAGFRLTGTIVLAALTATVIAVAVPGMASAHGTHRDAHVTYQVTTYGGAYQNGGEYRDYRNNHWDDDAWSDDNGWDDGDRWDARDNRWDRDGRRDCDRDRYHRYHRHDRHRRDDHRWDDHHRRDGRGW